MNTFFTKKLLLPSRRASLSFFLLFLLACSGPGFRMPTPEEMEGNELLHLGDHIEDKELSRVRELLEDDASVRRLIHKRRASGGTLCYVLVDEAATGRVRSDLRNAMGKELELTSGVKGSPAIDELRSIEAPKSDPTPTIELPGIFDIFTRIY